MHSTTSDDIIANPIRPVSPKVAKLQRMTESPSRRWFAVPAPIRSLFKLFPLQTYEAEGLPCRSPDASRPRPVLYIFASEEDGRPSYNPSCLKWQAVLRIAGVDVDVVSSNNHASPSGTLPFLLLPGSNGVPLTGNKILKYARDHASRELSSTSSPRLEAYQSLLTQAIRPAWLHELYLNPENDTLLRKLYLPSNPLLALSLHQNLQNAASTEILKTTRTSLVLQDQLLSDAETALEALSTVLGDDQWFFGGESPSPFDAEVFAYTHLALDRELGWGDDSLGQRISKFSNLVAHNERLYREGWGEKTG